jgi:hypothetical protein
MNYLEKQKNKRRKILVGTYLFVVVMGICSMMYFFILKQWEGLTLQSWVALFLGVILTLAFVKLSQLFDGWYDGRYKEFGNFKKGIEGETAVITELKRILSVEYSIIPSVDTGSNGDADIIVVGPKGVLVIEVKNWSTKVEIEEKKIWRIKYGGKQRSLEDRDSFRQVKIKANDVDKLLRQKGVFVDKSIPILIFVGGKVSWEGKLPTWVCHIDNIAKLLRPIENKKEYNTERVQMIVKKLKKYSTCDNSC